MQYGSVFAPNLFAGKVIVVTGGGSGLGEATARELARLGAKVAVLDLNLDNALKVTLDSLKASIPQRALT